MICSEQNASCFLNFGSGIVKTTAICLVILLVGCATGEKTTNVLEMDEGIDATDVRLISIKNRYEKKIKEIRPDQSVEELKTSFSQVMELYDQCYENHIALSSEEDNLGKEYYTLYQQMTNEILGHLEQHIQQVNQVIENFISDSALLNEEGRERLCSAFQKKAFLLKTLLEVYEKSLSTNTGLEKKVEEIRKKHEVAQKFAAECR